MKRSKISERERLGKTQGPLDKIKQVEGLFKKGEKRI